jgi:hypothetical protein
VADPPDVDPESDLASAPESDGAREAAWVDALDAEIDATIDVARIEAEEAAAAQRLSMIAAGRRKGGVLGAAAAGVMIGLRDIYEGPPKPDDIVIISESPGEPEDIDIDGITGRVADVDFWAPPPHDPRA